MYEAKFVLSLDFGNRAHLPEWCCPCRIPWYRIVEIAFEQIEIYILFTMRFSLCLLESNQAKPWRSLDEPSQDKTSQDKPSQAKPSRVENKGRKEKDPDTVFASSCDLLAALKTAKTDREIPQVDRFTTSDRNRRPWNFRWRYITKTCIGLTRGKERTKPRSFDVFRFAE